MGASAKRKKEKKKDFQKTKLKVGKTKPKASNFTDTSFKSRSIVIKQQSLSTTAPSPSSQFKHHVSLLTSHSDTQCRDSLAFLTSHIGADAALAQPLEHFLPKILPLLTRTTSASLRAQLLRLFQVLPTDDVRDHVSRFVLYLRLGLTHLAAEVRTDSIEALDWLLGVAGPDLVACPGAWVRLTRCFLALFGWEKDIIGGGGSSSSINGSTMASTARPVKMSFSTVSVGKTTAEQKAAARRLQVFGRFLEVGISPPPPSAGKEGTDLPLNLFPLWHTGRHLQSRRSNCYAYLNLFGAVPDLESQAMEDREDRQAWFRSCDDLVLAGLEDSKRHAGEIGRAAAQVWKILQRAMLDYRLSEGSR
ncbi:MAG: hypothetical protein M1825_002569 [Sarcosagium campestre]|nr:MAG: hypothetical protein M1825_002569 [Sarcosagium campestre]